MVEGWGWPDEALPEEEELEEGGEEHWQWWGHNGWKEAVARVQEREKREEEGWGVEREEAAGGSGRERERVVFCLTTTAARIGGVEAVLRSVKGQSLRPVLAMPSESAALKQPRPVADAIYLSVASGASIPAFVRADPAVTLLGIDHDLGPVLALARSEPLHRKTREALHRKTRRSKASTLNPEASVTLAVCSGPQAARVRAAGAGPRHCYHHLRRRHVSARLTDVLFSDEGCEQSAKSRKFALSCCRRVVGLAEVFRQPLSALQQPVWSMPHGVEPLEPPSLYTLHLETRHLQLQDPTLATLNLQPTTLSTPVSYTHLTLPTICSV
eukprot:2640222-Rhodomonas_salina.1